jgi:ubiquinone/menaquinone biosynthesis C-methylase UbiE
MNKPMKTRGEKHYINMPFFAARLYDNLTSVKGVNKGFEEIASFVDKNLKQGKLLDIGTGPGRLLFEINKKNPEIELYGLDISSSMIEVAKQNLSNVKNVCLKVGNILKTEFQTGYFDCIVSSGSFYNWDNPIGGLNEVYRILKPDCIAYIFESFKDFDQEILNSRLKTNLKGYNFARKILSKYFLKKQLKMTYNIAEFDVILKQTDFKDSYKIEQIDLGNLPIYVRLKLEKK